MVPPPGYLAGVRELCDRHGIVLIADEVMAGFGRAGKWFADRPRTTCVPDLITFAKGVNSGYVPLGGVAISDAIAATFAHRAYPGGLTYSGHPLACAAAVATIDAMRGRGHRRATPRRLGAEVLGPGLRELADAARRASARCAGSAPSGRSSWSPTASTREPLAPYGGSSPEMAAVVQGLPGRGLLPFANFNRIHVVPPLHDDRRGGARGARDPRRGAQGRRRAGYADVRLDRPLTAYERHAPATRGSSTAALARRGTRCFWLEDAARAGVRPP